MSSKFDTHEPNLPSGNQVASCVLDLFDNHPPILESFQKEYKSTRVLSKHGWKNLAYKEWSPTENERKDALVVCVHGLTRNSSDFDYLAIRLVSECKFRVLSLDVIGRGRSEWLRDENEYGYPIYVSHVQQWLATKVSEFFTSETTPVIYWVGTSMGGLIALSLSSSLEFPVLSRLVLNDVGPHISAKSILRLAAYCGKEPIFESYIHARDYIKQIYAPFGNLSETQWETLVHSSVIPVEGSPGKWKVSYDHQITNQLAETVHTAKDIDLFDVLWDKIPKETKIMLLHGKESDILTPETIVAMQQRGPGIDTLVEFDDVGHAPTLLCPTQTDPILAFLSKST